MSTAEQRHFCPACNAVFRTPFSRCPLDGNVLAELDGDPLVGTTLDGRYVIEACIGEGGMGRVYRAKHTRMSRTYAIKILFGDHAGDSRMRSRFAREAEAVSRLNHVNVISVVDFGETPGGLLYLVMDLAVGESLAELMIREAPMQPARAVEILAKLAKGLSHAHNQGLVHRDFKGENVIMVTEEEQEVPKIVDFGICMITEDNPSNTMLTSNGMVMGTPAVMAPEQASGDVVDHRTDLFSLGIVGYQMLSGVLPFEGTPLDMARKNLYEPIPAIRERSGVTVAPALEAIIHKLTAKQPSERYQSAKDALADLKSLGLESADWGEPTPIPAPLSQPAGAAQDRHPSDAEQSSPGFGAEQSSPGFGAEQSSPGFGAAQSSPGFDAAQSSPGFDAEQSSPGFDAAQSSSQLSAAGSPATPMATRLTNTRDLHAMVTTSSKPAIIIGLLAVAAVAVAAFGLSRGSDNKPAVAAAEIASIDASSDVEPTLTGLKQREDDTETKTETEPSADTTGLQGSSVEVGTEPVTETLPDTEPETVKDAPPEQKPPRKNTGKTRRDPQTRKNANRKNANRKNRNKKHQVAASTPKPAPTSSEARRLYASVGGALNRLEAVKSNKAVAQLRRDYNAISITRLIGDSSLAPEYHQKLLRIRRKIRAAHK